MYKGLVQKYKDFCKHMKIMSKKGLEFFDRIYLVESRDHRVMNPRGPLNLAYLLIVLRTTGFRRRTVLLGCWWVSWHVFMVTTRKLHFSAVIMRQLL